MNIENDNELKKEISVQTYQQAYEIACVFWEWRHKVIMIFFAGIAGLSFLFSWMFDHKELHSFLYIPFFVGAIFCFIVGHMDKCNTWVLDSCYKIAGEYEKESRAACGVFVIMQSSIKDKVTYSKLLKLLYFGSAFILCLIGLIILFNK